jgi:cytochrome c-type biogenesis protein CcmH/NrfG
MAWLPRLDAPTWLFAVGTFFVILFLFLPLIKQAKTRRVKGALDLGTAQEKRKDEEFKKSKNPSQAEIAKREVERSDWAKESARLEAEHSSASAEAAMSDYWYTWGMMFSFMLLAGASLGYLNPAQPLIRRVIGATVLLAEVLLIFLRFVTTTR